MLSELGAREAALCRNPVQESLHFAGHWKEEEKIPSSSVSLQHPILAQHHSKCHRWNLYTAHLQDHRAGKEGWIWKWEAINCCLAQKPLSYVCFSGPWLAFSFFNSVFWKAEVFNFHDVQCVHFFPAIHAFFSQKNFCLTPNQRFSPMFSSKNWTVWAPRFRFMIHFKYCVCVFKIYFKKFFLRFYFFLREVWGSQQNEVEGTERSCPPPSPWHT